MDFLPISFFVGFWNSRKVLIVPRCVIDDGCWLGGRFRPENEIISDMQNDSRKMKGGKCVRVLQTFHVSDQLSRAAAAVAAFHWFTSSSNFSSKKCRRQFFEIIFEFFIHIIPILSSGQDTRLDWKKSLKFSDWPVGIWRPEKNSNWAKRAPLLTGRFPLEWQRPEIGQRATATISSQWCPPHTLTHPGGYTHTVAAIDFPLRRKSRKRRRRMKVKRKDKTKKKGNCSTRRNSFSGILL